MKRRRSVMVGFVVRASRITIAIGLCASGCTETVPSSSDATAETSAAGSSTGVGNPESSGEVSTVPSSGPDSSGETGTTMSTEESGTSDLACEVDTDCLNPFAPICIDNLCSRCDVSKIPDAACEQVDPERPLCGADGSCVQCTTQESGECVDATPICDEASWTCVRCARHDQCPASACDTDTGECFSEKCVVDVDADGGEDVLDLDSAMEWASEYASCVIRIHPSDEDYPAQIAVTSARRIALLGIVEGPEEHAPLLYINDLLPILDVSDGAAAYVSNLRLDNAEVRVGAAFVRLDRTDVANQFGSTAIHTVDAAARVVLVDSWIDGGYEESGAVSVDGGNVEGTFTTIFGHYAAVSCAPSATAQFRNSFLFNTTAENEIDCAGIDLSYSALEHAYIGVGNQALGPLQPEWFFSDGEVRRLSPSAPALLGVTARWALGDSNADIDGDPRPDRDGTMTFAGADVTP